MKTVSLLIIALVTGSTTASAAVLGEQHRTSDAPFLTPREAVAKMAIPEGFDVSIFAAEPTIGEPIAFTFDDRGRIWVVENYNYINRRSHTDEKVTRIQILEDTDSDGVFDTKKTFTDDLTFSSGIAVGFGGVFVGAPPNFTFIPDADGDDKPDGPPEILLDGWGTNDRHETLNSFIWGPDGWLYGCHGVFTESHVGKPGTAMADRTFIDAGIWRWHPTKKTFEIFARGLSNPWGFDFNDQGQGFATCCVIPHLFHVVQGGVYHKQSKPHLNPYIYDYIPTIRDHKHLSAHGGARFYLGDAFPAKYRDQLFMCNIHQHQLLTDVMTPKGSSYVGSHGEDFMSMNDLAWVGFSLETGPEGAVYILDWHDTDVCGNAINFPNSGRIYRVMIKGAKPIERPNIRSLTDVQLVALQNHPNDWYVRQARLHLQMRAASGSLNRTRVTAGLEKLLSTAKSSGKRLRAMWALQVIGALSEERLHQLLSHDDEYIRAFSVQFLSEEKASQTSQNRFVALAESDESSVVRLYLASALQRLSPEERWPILAKLSQHAEDNDDNNIPRMLWYAMEPMVPAQPEQALDIVVNGNMPKLQQLTARRMVSGDLPAQPQRGRKVYPGRGAAKWQRQIQGIAPGFEAWDVGLLGVVMHREFRNQTAFQTHPLSREKPSILKQHVEVPKGKTTTLKLRVSHHQHGDWQLRVLANDKVIAEQIVGPKTVSKDEWLNVAVDLSRFAGEHIDLTLENRANNWANEWGYWGGARIVSE